MDRAMTAFYYCCTYKKMATKCCVSLDNCRQPVGCAWLHGLIHVGLHCWAENQHCSAQCDTSARSLAHSLTRRWSTHSTPPHSLTPSLPHGLTSPLTHPPLTRLLTHPFAEWDAREDDKNEQDKQWLPDARSYCLFRVALYFGCHRMSGPRSCCRGRQHD